MATILDNVRALLGAKEVTVDDLSASISRLESQIPDLRDAVGRIEAERGASLIDGDDKLLTAIEDRLAKARRDLDRALAMRAELQKREQALSARNYRDSVLKERAEIEALVSAAEKELFGKYQKLAREAGEILERVWQASQAAHQWNSRHIQRAGVASRGDDERYAEFNDLPLIRTPHELIVDRFGAEHSVWLQKQCAYPLDADPANLPAHAYAAL